jgi:ABC-2 type transport system ATP-binding protein
MPEDDCFIPGMDAVSFTSYFGELSGMPRQEAMKRAHEVLFYVGLGESRYRNLETYSGGMKQRLKLAQAIVHDPKLIFLDEPTSALDPQGRKEILELIIDISSKKDIQVLISSHILPDIEAICSYVVILNKGKLAAQGDMDRLKQIDYKLYELRVKGESAGFIKKLRDKKSRIEEAKDGVLKVYLPPDKNPQDIFAIAAEENIQIRNFVKSRTTLEDLFAKAVGVE